MSQLGFGFDPVSPPPPPIPAPRPRRRPSKRAVQLSLLDAVAPEPPPASPVPLPSPADHLRREVRAKTRLELALRSRIGPEVLVILHDNHSTMISFQRRGRALYVRVHRMFAEAPESVLAALASFVGKERTTKREARLLDQWIAQNHRAITDARTKAIRARPHGEFHDLEEIFDRLNERYFGGRVRAQITWTRSARKTRRSSIQMGTYSDELRLIRVHPALDQAFVPTYFVEFVVFHEMLHQIHDIKSTGCGRREIHTEAFRADEQKFERYREALAWERQNLKRLLRY